MVASMSSVAERVAMLILMKPPMTLPQPQLPPKPHSPGYRHSYATWSRPSGMFPRPGGDT